MRPAMGGRGRSELSPDPVHGAFTGVSGDVDPRGPPSTPMARPKESEALVVDLMAGDPIVVAPDVDLLTVARILSDYDIGGLPVVDAEGRLVGVVSQTDLVRLSASSIHGSGWGSVLVREVMTRPAVTIRGSAPLTDAARMMTEREVDRLVVVGDHAETALGVISDSDLVRAFSR
jgi:CBS domain-containing protein